MRANWPYRYAMTEPRRHTSDSIARDLEQAIRAGQWQPGQQLPTQAELAARYDVARMTVTTAIKRLKEMGLITSRRGAGAFVTSPSDSPAISEVLDEAVRGGQLLVSALTRDPRLVHAALRKPLAAVVAGTRGLSALSVNILLRPESEPSGAVPHLQGTVAGLREDGTHDAHMEVRTLRADTSMFDFILVNEADLFLPVPSVPITTDAASALRSCAHFGVPSSDPRVAESVFQTSAWFEDAWSSAGS